jgi:hypothetical protein
MNKIVKVLLFPLALISLCSCDVKIMPPLKEILSFHGFLTSLETMEDVYRKRSGAVNLPSGLFYDYPGYVYRVLKKMNPETLSKEPTTSMEWDSLYYSTSQGYQSYSLRLYKSHEGAALLYQKSQYSRPHFAYFSISKEEGDLWASAANKVAAENHHNPYD